MSIRHYKDISTASGRKPMLGPLRVFAKYCHTLACATVADDNDNLIAPELLGQGTAEAVCTQYGFTNVPDILEVTGEYRQTAEIKIKFNGADPTAFIEENRDEFPDPLLVFSYVGVRVQVAQDQRLDQFRRRYEVSIADARTRLEEILKKFIDICEAHDKTATVLDLLDRDREATTLTPLNEMRNYFQLRDVGKRTYQDLQDAF
jgi:hypothetical protein